MTTLIYRGFAYTASETAPAAPCARDLIYRGVRHDGLSTRPAPRIAPAALRYRGAPHGAAPARPVKMLPTGA
ncbi:DUF4278 domain-containing protein [Jannaschia seohaensis]|uniref:Uncharacterized protein DUF4278 n=1 Tax=Jannaschia seohaensis TaxID=475081 RepID=A0A2Y9ABL2_9RHOB|nr:DUF4278 domain-containing protein [Jannaschia seohaensis]PWJ21385.1 uncharacterized protein DUF4278 [Jannaschia seohaensis]SSA41991.1 protein of unknown function [Jannaschia seohaensis]